MVIQHRSKNVQQRIIHRLKIARGHLNKVIEMAEEQTYCIDVIHQSQAVQRALEETDILLLENHLRSCVSHAIRYGRKDEAIKEVLEVFKKSF